MVNIRTIQVRLTRQQYDQISNDCNVKGFNSLSAYFRYLALYRDQATLKKIIEIHDAVVPSESTGKARRQDETLRKAL